MNYAKTELYIGHHLLAACQIFRITVLLQFLFPINGSENREIIGECDGTHGWILLGRYRLFPGECKIVLTDEGEKDQVLLGDAIKWKYVD